MRLPTLSLLLTGGLALFSQGSSAQAGCRLPEEIPSLTALFATISAPAPHPLLGTIGQGELTSQWHARCQSYWKQLSDRLSNDIRGGGIVLIGEIHDNPFHHQFRAAFLNDLHAAPWVKPATGPAAIAFEQFPADQQAEITATQGSNASLDRFLTAINWASSGWAQYDYRPLLDAALAAKMPIYAGDVPKSIIRLAAKQGETAIAPEERARLKLDVPLPAHQQDAILTELEASHCGMMPKSAFGGMAFAQRLRDATLADVALKAQAAHGSAIVMAGNGHVRADRGIAWYIRQREPGIKVVTVALVEVEDGKTDPAAYVPLDPEGKPAVDYVVFTPKHVRPDPCDAFKKKP
jgi:uncharacterized iron-regulated protein